MRLASLRLAGFKSFVEPTEILFPSELVGIVGPNGCGKSNTLDAVRWVMGESSAKHLRGQSLDDVIFAGSGQRKAVAQASVELVFDNSAGQLKGPWARPGEISVRRVLSRDGPSKYFLNGTRCRRKDIADLFLGTGLGSRSYAIIEQGQIARLIEARPEDMRATLEEAAGISRYKEKRRETEGSILHTRENLARINDMGAELARQLDRIERQARAAERFRLLQGEEQRLELAVHALQWRRLHAEQGAEQARLAIEEAGLHQAQAEQRQAATRLDAARADEAARQEDLHQAQAAAHAEGAEVARLEQALRHAHELLARLAQERLVLEHEGEAHARQTGEAGEQLAGLTLELGMAEDAIAPLDRHLDGARSALTEAERKAAEARAALEHAQTQAQEPAQQVHVERTRLEHAERQIQGLRERQQRLRIGPVEDDIRRLDAELAEARAAREGLARSAVSLDADHETREQAIQSARATLTHGEAEADALRREEAGVAAELRALHALEQAHASDEPAALRDWLKRHGLDGARAGERVRVTPEWAETLDTVLKDALNATPVSSLDEWREAAADGGARGLWMIEAERDARPSIPSPALSMNGEGASFSSPMHGGGREGERGTALGPAILHGELAEALLHGLRPIDRLDQALARRHELGPGEAWLTPDGDRIARHGWRRPPAPQAGGGMLARRLRLTELETLHRELQPRLAEAQALTRQVRGELQALDARHGAAQREQRELLRRQGEAATRVEQRRLRLEQAQGRLRGQQREQAETQAELARLEAQSEAHRQVMAALEQALAAHETDLHAARMAREQAEQSLDKARDGLREAERQAQEARSRVQSLARERALREQTVRQLAEQAARIETRRAERMTRHAEAEAPLAEMIPALALARAREADQAARLGRAGEALSEARQRTRQAHEALLRSEHALEGARTSVEGRRLTVQALALRAEAPGVIVAEAGHEAVESALEALAGLDVEAIGARLDDTRGRIARLGAVNLAALEEFKEARQRKDDLEAQQADLNEAIATLEAAMARMDRETRGRFRETFEAVNAKLGETFQRLFGGGEAHLSLTSEDWLEAGVALMARPPGKKISHIHLLSGGEKSLTAIALVFAIFQLNPAPFCLLDEVDAPLDEANVGRFCAMVRGMSEQVQFIFITHNKTTMELARQLVGVTMREAGVSRIVAVDLDAAVRLVETRAGALN